MGSKGLLLGFSLVVIVLLLTAIPGFSQVQPAQSRIPQQVLINGQTVNAANVIAPAGGYQAFTCLNPQQYTTLDGTSQGWACYEQATGVWLLNALPPAQARQPVPPPPPVPVPQPQAQPPAVVYPQPPPAVVYALPPPTVIYQQPPPTIIYTTPAYPVYPAYPVVVAPAYPASVVLGTAAIDAAGRIISSAIGYHYPRGYYYGPVYRYPLRGWRR